jgi:hypothetical protein
MAPKRAAARRDASGDRAREVVLVDAGHGRHRRTHRSRAVPVQNGVTAVEKLDKAFKRRPPLVGRHRRGVEPLGHA